MQLTHERSTTGWMHAEDGPPNREARASLLTIHTSLLTRRDVAIAGPSGHFGQSRGI